MLSHNLKVSVLPPHLMLVLDVPLEVNLLTELDVTDAALEATDLGVNHLMASQVTAGCGAVWTLVTGIWPTSCKQEQTQMSKLPSQFSYLLSLTWFFNLLF